MKFAIRKCRVGKHEILKEKLGAMLLLKLLDNTNIKKKHIIVKIKTIIYSF